MRKIKLTKQEKAIEDALVSGEYVDVGEQEGREINEAVAAYQKNTSLNIKVNRHDLENIKQKAKRLGVTYQAFISDIIHRVAQI